MFLKLKQEAEAALRDSLSKSGLVEDLEWEKLPESLLLEESEHADVSSSLAFFLASMLKMSPKDAAARLVTHAADAVLESKLISEVRAVGPYINFYAGENFFQETLRRIKEEGCDFGSLGLRGKIILEHTSANPDGPLHVGHLRNATIGDVLARVLRKAGYEVETQYYVNDMGRQVAVAVLGADRFGLDATKKGDHAVVEAYVRASRALEESEGFRREAEDLMRRYEAGDPEVVRKYREVVEKSLSGARETLTQLGIKHDRFVWESEFVRNGDVRRVLKALRERAEVVEEGGALVLKLEGFEKELVLQRSDGTTLYSTRDLAYHIWKAKLGDRMIDVLGKDHELVSKQLARALEILGVPPPEVVIFEFVSLPTGSMSTRAGKFVAVDELLDKVEAAALDEVEKRRPDFSEEQKRRVARIIGVGAIRYDIAKVSPEKPMVFDFEQALDMEKRGAPFIQYAHARASSILRLAAENGYVQRSDGDFLPPDFDATLLSMGSERALIRELSKLDYVVEKVVRELKPHHLAKYGRVVAETFNRFYRDCPVLNAEPLLRDARLNLVYCTKLVLKETLRLLGMEAPEEM